MEIIILDYKNEVKGLLMKITGTAECALRVQFHHKLTDN
jgi:hypothetical protein